jgi:catecholate siderophore receptor
MRMAGAASQPDLTAVSLATLGPNTVLTRGTNNKIQDMDTLNIQSDFSKKFEALGLKHELLAGVDLATEDKTVYAVRTAGTQGGVTLNKPNTTVGTPNDGAWVNEGSRVLRVNNQYASTSWGAYMQDLVQVAPHWKVLGGLRYDSLKGNYDAFGTPPNATDNGTQTSYQMKVGEWSKEPWRNTTGSSWFWCAKFACPRPSAKEKWTRWSALLCPFRK